MDSWTFTSIINKYKRCPNCKSSYKDNKMSCALENEIITISCECGWQKKVDEKNKEVK